MSLEDFEDDWERKKGYLIRTMFSSIPVLSPIRESVEPQESDHSSSDSRDLPELIIVPEKKIKNDHSERFYNRLEVRMKKYYRHLFYGEPLSDDFGESLHESSDEDQDSEVRFEIDSTAYDQQDFEDSTYEENLSDTAENTNTYELLAKNDSNDENGTESQSPEDSSLIYVVEEESSKSSTKWETVETQAVIEKDRAMFKGRESETVEEIHKEMSDSETEIIEDLSEKGEDESSSTKWEIVETQAVIEKDRAMFEDRESEAVQEINEEMPDSDTKESEDLCQGSINSREYPPKYNPFDFDDESEINDDLAERGGKENQDTDEIIKERTGHEEGIIIEGSINSREYTPKYNPFDFDDESDINDDLAERGGKENQDTDEIIKERTGHEEGIIIEVSENSSASDDTFKITVNEKEKAIFEVIEKEARQDEEEASNTELETMRKLSYVGYDSFQKEKEYSKDTLPELSPSDWTMEFVDDAGSATFTPKGVTPQLSTSTPQLSHLGTKRAGSFSDEVLAKRKRREEIIEPNTKDIETQTFPIKVNDVATQATVTTRDFCMETDINNRVYEITDESIGGREYEDIHTQTETQNTESETQTDLNFDSRWFRCYINAFLAFASF